jgi:hypothetical protein
MWDLAGWFKEEVLDKVVIECSLKLEEVLFYHAMPPCYPNQNSDERT